MATQLVPSLSPFIPIQSSYSSFSADDLPCMLIAALSLSDTLKWLWKLLWKEICPFPMNQNDSEAEHIWEVLSLWIHKAVSHFLYKLFFSYLHVILAQITIHAGRKRRKGPWIYWDSLQSSIWWAQALQESWNCISLWQMRIIISLCQVVCIFW